ncbi:MAG: PQQ-binding-like beta-propeller repeat protein, partial [Verrucomicrobiales bacterium]
MKVGLRGLGSPLIVAVLTSLLIGSLARAQEGDPVAGDHLWTFDPGLPDASVDAFTEPAIGPDGTIYIGHNPSPSAGSGMFYAINPDGTLRWSKNFLFHATWEQQTMGFRAPSIDPAGNIYFSAGRNLYSYTAGGTENWKRVLPLTFPRDYAPYIYPIAISEDGRIYMPIDDRALHELDPADGSTLWT